MDSLNKLKEMINSFPSSTFRLIKIELLQQVDLVEQESQDYQGRSITWSILDFEGRAKQREKKNWKNVYDETKFRSSLEKMINAHDAEYGITWITVDWFLDTYCKK